MRPPSPSIPEKEFLVNALEQNLRLDGRAALEMRTPELTFGTELGCVECAFGKTRCVLLHMIFATLEVSLLTPFVPAQSVSPSGRKDDTSDAGTTVRGPDTYSFRDITYGFK